LKLCYITVLITLIILFKKEMFQYAVIHPKLKANTSVFNNQNLTPINLAAMIGRTEIFEKILELSKKVTSNNFI
jgi:hypothetical protein